MEKLRSKMKKIAVIFVIVGLVVGVAYASLDELLEHYGTDKTPESNEESSASLKEIFKRDYREEAKLVKIMSEAKAEVDAESREQIEQTNKSLIVAVFSSIPDVIWAAIIASGLTFLGVTLANRANRKCLILQLNYDTQQKEKERQMSLRRDVYLFAAEKLGQQLSYLANYYQTQEPPPKGYGEAIAKIDVIGNNETVNSVNKFNDCLAKAYCELIPERQELDFLGMKSDSILKLTQEASQRVQKSLEDMKEYNLGDVINPQKWSFIQGDYDLHCKERDRSLKELDKNLDKQLKLIYELAIKCRQKTQLAEELLVPVIVAVRKELDTPFDEEAFQAMMKTSLSEWEKNLDQFVKSMKDKFEQFRDTAES